MKYHHGFSIIIPTYQEAKNITNLIKAIAKISHLYNEFEVILIDDDSQDGTIEIVNTLNQTYPWIRLFVRPAHLGKSWSLSILKGMELANYPIFIFMDADLSHPPETIPCMLSAFNNDKDIIIGSRYMHGGKIDDKWPWFRIIISFIASLAIKPLLPSNIKDPLSGFIAIKQTLYLQQGKNWNPLGTKLALEIIIKSKVKNFQEIPIAFKQRQYGKSKLLNKHIAWLYIKQIIYLWKYKIFCKNYKNI